MRLIFREGILFRGEKNRLIRKIIFGEGKYIFSEESKTRKEN